MSGASNLSPLRARLCSRENAIRVAQRMMQAGIAVMVAPGDDMQPWRLKPATPRSTQQIDDALKLMRRARGLLREAGASKAAGRLHSAINSAEGARRHCQRRPVVVDTMAAWLSEAE